jgi:hypothetical protein
VQEGRFSCHVLLRIVQEAWRRPVHESSAFLAQSSGGWCRMLVCRLHGLQAGCALAAANTHEKALNVQGSPMIEKWLA